MPANKLVKHLCLVLPTIVGIVAAIACSASDESEITALNEQAYAFRYRNLDSTFYYADRALHLSKTRGEGYAEALNNLAFVSMARMEYNTADTLLSQILSTTDNQIELLVADVQMMRLCQRRSRNKDFYVYRESAMRRLKRIEEEKSSLNNHQERRMIYARSEFAIINSTYFYYVGLEDLSIDAIKQIDINGEIVQDTAQFLNYLYNVGAGGIVVSGTHTEINQTEFDYLMRCYLLAKQFHYPYWEANSLQAISEHLEEKTYRDQLIRDNLPSFQFINTDHMPDSLLAGNLARRSLDIFTRYGDVYQIAGAYRTLAECYWELKDYRSALICLHNALEKNRAIVQAPDLVASIREQLSLAYSALDNKRNSDYNRNIYLDIQEKTRQDRQLEARADQLNRSSQQLNRMILAIIVMIVIVSALLVVFDYMRKRSDSKASTLTKLLEPLKVWQQENALFLEECKSKYAEIEEEKQLVQMHLLTNKKRNIEQRAKISLVNSITPLIDRILHEIKRLTVAHEEPAVREERYEYIAELTDQINDYNTVLTHWIQLRQGVLSLKIESFPLQSIFDMLRRSSMAFKLKGIDLQVEDTDAIVKADKILTLFMLNTLADNAKKFTAPGGTVCVYAKQTDEFVDIFVHDTGVGIPEEQLAGLFLRKPISDESYSLASDAAVQGQQHSHGFGLMNCKGIIDRYKKTSKIFDVCEFNVTSKVGKGSTFSFRIPKGLIRTVLVLCTFAMTALHAYAGLSGRIGVQRHRSASICVSKTDNMGRANLFADSAYYSNINGTYRQTLSFADSCIYYLNRFYRQHHPHGKSEMVLMSNSTETPAELKWLHDSLPINYNIILDIRNESAVAALALHRWALYSFNNRVYTQLFRERSADNTLGTYVNMMQESETNKNVAIIILLLIFGLIFPAYYFLYYRHRVYYRFCVDKINGINQILLSDISPSEKLRKIEHVWTFNRPMFNAQFPMLNQIVEQIKEALRQSIQADSIQYANIELAEDELRRTGYENDQLYISNSVLDNCLSTLKHETMYYPSKIRLLVDGRDDNLKALNEVSSYYKELYALLSAQAMRQLDKHTQVDYKMLNYLFDILKERNAGTMPLVTAEVRDDIYSRIHVAMVNLQLTDEQVASLFTLNTINLQYMLCRQIIRDIGEATNARACGIQATRNEQGTINIHIILTTAVWNHLRLS